VGGLATSEVEIPWKQSKNINPSIVLRNAMHLYVNALGMCLPVFLVPFYYLIH
jgi:hypothetical protein